MLRGPDKMLSPSLILLGLIADVIIAVNQVVSCLTERTDEFGRPIHSFYTLFWIHFVSERGWILAMCTVPIEFVFLEQAWRNRVTENYWGGDVADKDPFAMLYWAGLRFTRIIPAGKNIFVFLMNLDPKSVSRAVQRLIKSIATLFLVLHLFCCLMFAISQWDNTKESWAWNDGLMELTFMAQYSKSFYAAQLGIFFHLRQTNTNFERLFAILETLLAAIVFGVLFGVILGVVRSQAKTTASRFEKEESIREVTIRDSMVRLGIPPRLQDEVIRHRRHRFLAMKAEQEKWAFQDLPGPLCQDIYNGLYLSTVTACPLFKGLDLEICQAIARGISTSVLPSTTAVFFQGQEAQELFIIKRGRVQLLASAGYDSDELVEFAVLGPNQFLGESDIDETMNYTALTMEETEFCLITKCYLAEVCELFPKLAERIVQCMDSRARSIEHLQGKVTSGLMPLIPEVSDDGEEEEEPARPHDHRSGAILVPTIFTAEPAEEDTAAQAAPTSPPLESPPQSARDSIVSDRSGAWSFEKARTKSFRSSAAKSTSVLVDDTGKLLPSSPSNEARRASWAGSASKVGNDITGTYTPPITGNKKAILGSSLSAFRDPSFLQVPGLKSMAASDITHLQVVIPASPPRTPPCGSLLSPVSAGSRNPMPETRSQLVVPSQRQQTPLSPHNHSNSLQGTEPIAAGIQEAPPFSSPSPHREDSSQRSPTSTTSVRLSQIAAFSPDSTGANYANRSLSPPVLNPEPPSPQCLPLRAPLCRVRCP
ncbi:hypothetical protein DFJ73DRAFT_305156 [Zopfochytrium polystomum]|nr:hypothetical protein DFJ73DRAFT_305156 [Zopfochytrium polystomum]